MSIGARMDDMSKTEGNIEQALNKFRGIEGRDFYPQIYIPFYEEAKERRLANPLAKEALVAEDPVVVLYAGDETQTVYTGYMLNDSGELTESTLEIDEEYALYNEVWVISLNERIVDIDEVDNSTTGTLSSPSALIDKIRIKCHKESWLAGASEVNIITFISDYRFYDLHFEDYGGGDHEGGRIYKFSRSSVRYESMKDINFYIYGHWDSKRPNAPYAHYVIFEYDSWPTGRRDAKWVQGSDELTWKYRSSDGYYDKNTVYKTNFWPYQVNNSCIEWFGLYQ